MPDRRLTIGRLSLNVWVVRPRWQRINLGVNAYTDGVTAGCTVELLWLSLDATWTWNHSNCPGCRGMDKE